MCSLLCAETGSEWQCFVWLHAWAGLPIAWHDRAVKRNCWVTLDDCDCAESICSHRTILCESIEFPSLCHWTNHHRVVILGEYCHLLAKVRATGNYYVTQLLLWVHLFKIAAHLSFSSKFDLRLDSNVWYINKNPCTRISCALIFKWIMFSAFMYL